MKEELPDNIEKLLKSTVIEDIILGVIWCYKNKRKNWCLKNFNNQSDFAKVNHTGHVVFLEFDNMDILIGYSWIDTDMRAYTKKMS